MSHSIPDRDLDPPYRSHGTEIIDARDWSAPCVRCLDCGAVSMAAGLHRWDDGVGATRYRHDDIRPVCPDCQDEGGVDVLGHGIGPCQSCGHAAAMPDDDWCYSCAVSQELDDVSVVPRYHRAQEALKALPSVSEFIASMFRDMHGARP